MPLPAPTPADLAATLLGRRRARQLADERRTELLRERARILASRLRQEGSADAVWLVGSLAWGGFGERSDVDLVVGGADPSRLGRLWVAIADELEADVDLLRLEDLPQAFRARVLAEGVRLDEP